MLAELLTGEVFAAFLVFARLGTALSLLPGFGEPYVFARVRLAVAIGLSLAVLPLVRDTLPAQPAEPLQLGVLIGSEMLIGAMLGATARMLVSALHVAGVVVAFQSGLAYAQTIDPSQGSQGGLVAALFGLLGLVLVFASGLHVVMLTGLADSYAWLPAGRPPPLADFAQLATRLMAASFATGIQIAAPFVLFGLVFYTGLGLLQRLMPQLQLMFVAMPLQITLMTGLIMLTLSAGMLWFLDRFQTEMQQLMSPA
jgi:flagellar biosynthesis protein FliR